MTTPQPHEINAWLGPARDELTSEQYETFTRLATSHPGEAAWLAALEAVTGHLDIRDLADADTRARTAAAEARTRLRQAVVIGLEAGVWRSEDEAARAAGVTRMTIRSWAGK